MKLAGRAALVTGADGGLGSAICAALAREGAAIAAHTWAAEPPTELVRSLTNAGADVLHVAGDVRRAVDVDRFVDATLTRFGQLDILVNNAGMMNTTPLLDLCEDDWDAVLDTNLKGYFLVAQRVARHMVTRRYGRIVNISSTRQAQAFPGNGAYATAKGGVLMLTRMLALELAPHGIAVNSIAPGTVLTDLNRAYLSDPEFQRERIARIPAGRLGRPSDVAEAVLLFTGAEADFLVGASLTVDGGQTLW
ncbi:SDR family NAD(P)-dependent oxidoreductase [Phytohabitans kaempferiae]|uniref:SDR family NAD(P)-dependent oxidoreductase n=1 Tax=Phytohabitans kaempferiae TaxID=1620943 RepID=A0ABV6MAR7_9ACTN